MSSTLHSTWKRTLRRIGPTGIFVLCSLLYCSGVFWFSWPSARPGQVVIYPLVLAYNYSSLLAAIGAALALFVLMILRVVRWFRAWPVALGLLLFLAGGLFSWDFYYEELDAIQFNDHAYRLGFKGEPPAQFLELMYLLCQCDNSGILCQCRDFYWTRGAYPQDVRLVADQDGQYVRAVVNDKTIYMDSDPPKCFEVLSVYGSCLKAE